MATRLVRFFPWWFIPRSTGEWVEFSAAGWLESSWRQPASPLRGWVAGVELASASEPPAREASDLGASPSGRRPQPPLSLRCNLLLNHARMGLSSTRREASDLGALPFGRRLQPPLSCDPLFNHAETRGAPGQLAGDEFPENCERATVRNRRKNGKLLRDSSLNSTIPELPGSGWLAAEPEATPQTHRLRPWGFPQVSPSYPSVFPHHGIQRITVEFSENSHYCWPAPEPLASRVDVRVPEARCSHKRRPTPAVLVAVGLG